MGPACGCLHMAFACLPLPSFGLYSTFVRGPAPEFSQGNKFGGFLSFSDGEKNTRSIILDSSDHNSFFLWVSFDFCRKVDIWPSLYCSSIQCSSNWQQARMGWWGQVLAELQAAEKTWDQFGWVILWVYWSKQKYVMSEQGIVPPVEVGKAVWRDRKIRSKEKK